jgi:hypothetical protein
MADLTRNIIYRSFRLNDEDQTTNYTGGNGIGTGISGCTVDSFDLNDVDVVQFMEKRSLEDGMDVGDVFKGARRVRISGVLSGTTRADLYDKLADLRAALDPVLAQADEPADKGYQPLYFSDPTLRVDEFPSGYIDKRVLAMPRAIGYLLQRDAQGGDEDDSLSLAWQATLVCADPRIMGETEQDYTFGTTTIVTGATASAATNLITKATHGLVAGDRVTFSTLTGGTGLNTTTTYYVIATGLTSGVFAVSTTSGGSAVDITVNYSAVSYVKSLTNTGSLVNRGNHYGVLNMLLAIGAPGGTVSVQAGTSVFTITLPASTGDRIVRLKGSDKVLTVEDVATTADVTTMDEIAFSGTNTWPQVQPGTHGYSVTFNGIELQTGSHMWFWESYA